MFLHSYPTATITTTTTTTTKNRINTNPKTELATTFDSTKKLLNYSKNITIHNEINYSKMQFHEHNNYYPHYHNHHQTPISSSPVHRPLFASHPQQPPKQVVDDVKIELEDDLLWSSFAEFTNEMILTKAGRRTFPLIRLVMSGMEENALYTVQIEFRYADNFKYRFMNGEWRTCARSEPTLLAGQRSNSNQQQPILYEHPDSPNFGHHWCKDFVAFAKLKLSNNENHKCSDSVFLKSLLKYEPCIHVYKHDKKNVDDRVLVKSQSFPQTAFIAVTAYQNEQITALKIKHNPFAKAFINNKPMITIENGRVVTSENTKMKRERVEHQHQQPLKRSNPDTVHHHQQNRGEILPNWYSYGPPPPPTQAYNINQFHHLFNNRPGAFNVPSPYPISNYEQQQHHQNPTHLANNYVHPNYLPIDSLGYHIPHTPQLGQKTNYYNNDFLYNTAYETLKRHAAGGGEHERPTKRTEYQSCSPVHDSAHNSEHVADDCGITNDSLDSNDNFCTNNGRSSVNNSSSNASSSSFALSFSSSLQ